MSSGTVSFPAVEQPPISDHPDANRITSVRADESGLTLDLAKLWHYRSLVLLLVWRDFKVKYKQSLLGGLWIILMPFVQVAMYTLVFGGLARMDSEGMPFAVYNYVGMLPWQLFAMSLPSISSSLVGNTNLVQKVHFPRVLLPIYGAMTCVPDFLVLFGIQFVLLGCFGYWPNINFLWYPLFMLWAVVLSLAVGFFVSAISARYRDATTGVAFLVQIWFFATPIVYSPQALGSKLQWVMLLNPMSWVVRGARWGILGTESGPEPFLLVPLVGTLVLFVAGYYFFRWTERSISDVI